MKRDYLIICIALVLFFGSLVTTLDTTQQRDFNLRGYVDASSDANLPFRVPQFGVNAELTQYDSLALKHNLELMEQAHVIWLRQIIRWSEIEPARGQMNWDKVDAIFATLKQHPRLKPIIVLESEPDWSRPIKPTPTAPPTNTAVFANFAGAFAARYGEQVDYYQIWDEPNLTAAWGNQEPDATAYTALLAAAYKTIHQNDPIATVIAAALAPTVETGPKNISDILYLHDMYAVGAKDYMDAVGAKPYGYNDSPENRTISPDDLNFSRIIALREEMVRNGDAKKALWASEWGWNSLPANWKGESSIWGAVASQTQVDYTLAALNRANREWPWLAGMTLSQWQPNAPADNPIWGFALIHQNNQPGALWAALSKYQIPQQAQNGLFPAVNPNAHYSGVWTFGPLGADIGWVQDSQFSFDFDGSDVALLLRQDNYTAYLYPTVDGQQANAIPRDASGNHYIVLTSPSLLPETNLIPVAINLPSDKHTLHVIADRGWDRWAIAGFAVSSGSLSLPYDHQIAIGWITTLFAALSMVVTAWRIRWGFLENIVRFTRRYLSATFQFILSIFSSLALLIGMMLTWGDGVTGVLRHEPVSLLLAIATSGLIKLQPGFVLTIIAAAILFIIFYNYPHIGLALTIFWAPFFLFPVELYRFAFPLAEVMIFLTAAAWFLHLLSNYARWKQTSVSQFRLTQTRDFVSSRSAMDYLLLIWLLLGVISLLWTQRLPQATTELRVIFVEPLLFYLIFRSNRLTRIQILLIVDAFIIAGLIVAIIGLFQYVQGEAIITAEAGSRRLASVYGSPNNVALFLGRCIPFALAFVFVQLDKRRRVFYLIALVPMGVALLLTQSVGGIFIGVPISVAAVLLLSLRRRARYVLLLLIIILVIGFIFSLQSERFARVLDFSSGTNFYRVRAWLSAVNIIHDRPITGLGLDQFLYAFRGRYILPDAWQEPNLSHPHNILLDFWVRLGLMGVVLLFVLQTVFWRTAVKFYRQFQKTDKLYLALIICTIGSMINLIGHGLIDNSVFVQDLSYVFVLLLALVQIGERAIY
jgi:O-antigen ligase